MITGNDIFNQKKYTDIFRLDGKTELLKIITTSYFVTNLHDNTLHALEKKYNQQIQIDLKSDNLQKEVMEYLLNMTACTVTVLSYGNLHKIIHVEKK